MAKQSKISQVDSRGQLVIPKELRKKLNIFPGTGFHVYDLSKDTLLLKKIPEVTIDLDKARKLARGAVR